MHRIVLALLPLAAALIGAPATAQGAQCDMGDLQKMAASYLAAQAAGDATKLPFADFTSVTENGEIGSLASGMISKAQKIDFSRTLYDLRACQTYSELVVTDAAHPYVIGTRLQFAGRDNPIAANRVNDIEIVATDKGDWAFNAGKTLLYAKGEDWGEIPEGRRDTRATLMAAANAYLDSWNDPAVKASFANPCALLEGGYYTGKGAPGAGAAADRCDLNLPSKVKIAERHVVVDEPHGAVAVFFLLGDKASPDVHSFRIEQGKIRYIHTLTACATDNCGLPLSADMKRGLAD